MKRRRSRRFGSYHVCRRRSPALERDNNDKHRRRDVTATLQVVESRAPGFRTQNNVRPRIFSAASLQLKTQDNRSQKRESQEEFVTSPSRAAMIRVCVRSI